DWKPLARSAFLHSLEMGSMAEGFYQSVTCAEDVSFIRNEEIAAAVAGTFLGDFRVRKQKAACEGWPIRDLGAELQTPVASDVPALLISGERDPVTPPSYGERAARTLKRARHHVIPDAGHSTDGMQGDGCSYGIVAAFIQAGTAEGLDTSCIARMRRPDFELPAVTVARGELEGFPGSYRNEEMGVEVKVELVGDRLRLSVTQGMPFLPALLVPTSPTRFRWEGEGLAPGLAVVFKSDGGKAAALDILQPNKPGPVVMRRLEPFALAQYGSFAALAVGGVLIGWRLLRRPGQGVNLRT
ncbi:MAG TPA: alpha/beta fold hydrolase, partial [Thermoanaerobaculia bacterium]|nr:alpha/beta fold hydrolase [Thermoanaerobaculia bacterium]